MSNQTPRLGAIEAGGTKFVCAIATALPAIDDHTTIPTTTPEETIGSAIAWFRSRRIDALGVASFGPADLAPSSPTFGRITTTPKPGWRNADVVGPLRAALGVPVVFDTDVNGAVIGEAVFGAGVGADPLVYVTVGTGIGGGVFVSGAPIHGLAHPEVGHMHVRRAANDPFGGSCPFHRDCLEGLASGTAIRNRARGRGGESLGSDDPIFGFVAGYLGQLAANLVCTVSPKRLIFGGGVMHQPGMIQRVRAELSSVLAGYVDRPELGPGLDRFLVLPGLGDRAGVVGAATMARRALDHSA